MFSGTGYERKDNMRDTSDNETYSDKGAISL